jgi:hypothetical protein
MNNNIQTPKFIRDWNIIIHLTVLANFDNLY